MPGVLEVVALWLALDIVLVAGWHAAHVRARRAPSAIGAERPASTGAIQATYVFDRAQPAPDRRPHLVPAGASRT